MSYSELIVRDVQGERRIAASELPLRIGTSADCELRLPGPGGSPVLQLDLLDGSPIIQPLGRDTQLKLNNEPLTSSSRLSDGDVLNYFGSSVRVSLGDSLRLDVELEGSAYVTQAPEEPADIEEEEAIAPQAFRRASQTAATRPADSVSRLPVKSLLGAAVAFLLVAAFFLFTSRSIQFEVTPAPYDDLEIRGAWFKLPLGDRVLMRPGTYSVAVRKTGYYELTQSFDVGDEPSKTVSLELRPLPGQLFVNTNYTEDVVVTVNGATVGPSPLGPVELDPGEHSVSIESERFLPYQDIVNVEGRGQFTVMNVQLVPRWADVAISTEPAGARVYADETLLGETPLSIELLEGTHEISVVADGFRAWDASITAVADDDVTLPTIRLEPADARLRVESIPRAANVTVNGRYRGQTPIDLDLLPDVDYTIGLTRAGYGSTTRQIRLQAAASEAITVDMTARTGAVTVNVTPSDATVIVDGRARGVGSRTLKLSAAPHRIEVKRDGYEPFTQTITPRPGFPQTVTARLRSFESIRQASITREIETQQEATLVRVEPGEFSFGASRSEPGRRANEVIVPVSITQPFFIGTREVTNAEFREFKSTHDSGADVHISMAGDNNPVASVSWEEAVQYCNWLSQLEGLTPVYKEEFGKWVPIYPFPNGYRLPTEAEWAWAARYSGSPGAPRYSWGDRWPPREGSGNFADQSASMILNTVIPGFDDGFTSTAPVGRFRANVLGMFDVSGNVSEWVNDYYSVPTPGRTEALVDPTGPARGTTYVIRGSSWKKALQSDLRLSYRDSGVGGRDDVGFRIARNVE